jgi:hypothetical protein
MSTKTELTTTDWNEKHHGEAINCVFSQANFEDGYSAFKYLMQEYPELPIDWIQYFGEFKHILLVTDKIEEILNFIKWIKDKDPKKYKTNFEYIELDLCSYFILNNDLPRLNEHIQFIQQNPTVDYNAHTLPLLYTLIFHGYYDLAIDYAKKVWRPLTKFDDLEDDADYPFVQTLQMNKLQEYYVSGKLDEVARNSWIKEIDKLGLINDPGVSKTIFDSLNEPLDIARVKESIRMKDKKYLLILNIHFCKYMFENHKLPFILSDSFWSIVYSYDLFGEKKKVERWFFVNATKLTNHVNQFIFYDNILEIFGKVWGLVYVYKFLYDTKLINDTDYELINNTIKTIKRSLIHKAGIDLWQMNFIFKWPQVKQPEDFENEEQFLYSCKKTEEEISEFWEESCLTNYDEEFWIDDDDYLPDLLDDDEPKYSDSFDYKPQMPFIRQGPKVGRNDPCPCGSGKKYKKCCGG